MPKRIKLKSLSSPSVVAVLALMADGEHRTSRAIFEATGFSQPTADAVMESLHHHHMAYIFTYELDRHGKRRAVWAMGDKPNADHPQKRSTAHRAEMMRIYRRRYEDKKKGWEGSPIPKRDPLTVALFGEYQRPSC